MSSSTPQLTFRSILPILLAGAVLGIGLVVSGLLAWHFHRLIMAEGEARFSRLQENLREDVSRRFTTPHYGLGGARGMFAASASVERRVFGAYVASRNLAEEFPGILGFGMIKPVARADLAAFTAAEAADGDPGFVVKTTGEDAICYVITGIFPRSVNEAAWGFDVGAEPVRREAIEHAIDTGRVTLTRSITLVQDGQRTPGFLMVMPVFRNGTTPSTPGERRAALQVIVYAPIRAIDLLAGLDLEGDGLAVTEVWEGSPGGGGTRLHPLTGALPTAARFQHAQVLRLFGRDLHLHIHSTPALDATVSMERPVLLLLGGTVISLLAATTLLLLGRSRARVLAAAHAMTRDLRDAKTAAENALRDAEVYRTTLDQYAIVSMTDATGRIIHVNSAFCAISGYTREELLGRDHRVVNSGTHDQVFWRTMWSTVLAGKPWRGVVCNRAKDGSHYWVDSLITPFTGADGKLDRLVSIRFDITAQKRLEHDLHASESQLRTAMTFQRGVLDSANLSMIATDTQGTVTLWNAAATRMLQWTPEEMVGRQSPAVIHVVDEVVARARTLTTELGLPVEPGFDAFVAKARLKRVADEQEWTYVRKDGSRFLVLLSVTALRDHDDTVVGYLGIGADITERSRQRRELQQAMEAARAGAQAKAEFLAVMSHEIRTPMNGVIGMTNLLVKTPLDPQQREYVETVRSCGESLLTLINDILDFSKLEAGRVALESIPFSPARLVEDVVQLFTGQAEQKGLELTYQLPANLPRTLLGDPTRLRQVLLNLVSNAMKFTLRGTVTVTCTATKRGDGQSDLTITVRDTGVGMTPAQVARLGEAFTQADSSTTRRFGGSGLGMTISKALVHLMQGDFQVESVPDQGSTFRVVVTLPLAPDQETDEPSHSLHGRRVVCVDDDPNSLRVMAELCRGWNMEVESFATAHELMVRLRQETVRPDLLLTDHEMPGIDGVMLIRLIHADSRYASLPVVIASSDPDRARFDLRAMGTGVVIEKPLQATSLQSAIHGVLRGGRPGEGGIATPTSVKLARVLVVDDNRINQRVIVAMLKQYADTIDTADNGAKALAAVQAEHYDLVLMDCQMPEMDGYQATRAIRAREHAQGLSRLPIIALTAHAMEGARDECLAAGMDDYLSKPIRESDLDGALQRSFAVVSSTDNFLADRRGGTAHLPVAPATTPNTEDPLTGLRAAMSEADLRIVADAVISETPKMLAALEQALAGEDRVAIARIAHTFKGTSASLKVAELHQHSRNLESHAATAAMAELRAIAERLAVVAKRTVQYFRDYLDGTPR